MAAEEIVRLKVGITRATEAQISRLERLDRVLAALRQQSTVNINVNGLSQGMNQVSGAAQNASNALRDAANQQRNMRDTTEDMTRTQLRYNLLWDRLAGMTIRAFTGNLRDALAELKKMNAELVAVQKVTKATNADMERMKNSAFEVSGALGSTPSDYLASVTKWAQAGYNALSEDLGELSAKTQVVGNVNEETANKFLLAVDAAYKYKGNIDSLTRVLDGANEIGNQFATSVEKMAGGMGIVSSLAAQAGMKVEETVAAIGTITAVTQESGNSAARALRALILNIQGSTEIEIDAETGERWTEDEIQRTAAALDKLNVATREYKDGVVALRNPMEVIAEMSEKYRQGLITEAQLQEVVASLGGKVRSNQLMALISNYEMYNDMLETYRDSVGSADRELDIYLNGWEAKSNRLTAQWAQFVEGFQASDISMGLLDVGNGLLEIANTDLDSAVAQVTALTAAIILLNAAGKTFSATSMGQAITGAFSGLTGLIGRMSAAGSVAAGAAVGIKGLAGALYAALGPIGFIAVGLTAVITILDLLTVSIEEQAQATADAVSAYEKEQAALEGLESQLKTIQDRIEELNSRGDSLTVVEREELDRLKKENEELEWQIVLQKDLAEAKKRAAQEETNKSLNKGYTGANYNYQPWRDSATSSPALSQESIEYDLGRLSGFEKQAQYLEGLLDNLTEKKNQFLSAHGDGSWSDEEARSIKAIEEEFQAAKDVSAGFYKELYDLVDNLPEGPDKDKWMGLLETLREAMYPAKALTDQLNELVGEMDEAEQSRFAEALKQIQADGSVTTQEVQTLIDKFPVLKTLLEGNAGALDILAQYFTESAAAAQEAEAGIDGVGGAAQDSQKAMEDLAQVLNDCAAGAQTLSDAQSELKQNGALSANTLISLLGKYDDALDEVVLKAMAGLATQEEISQALQNAYEAEVNTYKKALLEKEMGNEDFYSSWLDGNAGTVKKLADQYGVDARWYKTFAELKTAIAENAQNQQVQAAENGKNQQINIFKKIQAAFSNAQDAMLTKAQQTAGAISGMYSALSGIFGGAVSALSSSKFMGAVQGAVTDAVNEVRAKQAEQAMQDVLDSFQVSLNKSSKSSSSKSGGSAKDWYETQIEALKKLEEITKRTNQVLERSDSDTAGQRVKNLQGMQEKILAAQKDFIRQGKDAASDEVNQLKILYRGLADDIESIYKDLNDKLLARHDRLEKDFELLGKKDRTLEQIAADDKAMVEQYRQMQQEVHELADRYRAQGVRENEDFMRELGDAWWDYQEKMARVFDNLKDHFDDYINESAHKIEELGRTTGTVAQRIEIYAQRIAQAQAAMNILQANNVNGSNDASIRDIQEQVWSDKDAIRDIQDNLWKELEDAFDDIFDKAKDGIDAVQDEIDGIEDQMDRINDILEQYDKELEGILKPINAVLKELNAQLEAEKKRLEALTAPLEERRETLSNQINGYYTVNPDGTIKTYIPGLDDQIDEIQDQLDDLNEEYGQIKDAWDEQKKLEQEALELQKKELAVEEAQKKVQDALLALQTARNERTIYTLKDGVWAWRADEEAVAKAEKALAEAEKAKEEAEKDLQDYKEEQAHNLILKRLEEQIKALEEQKKLLDKQKDLINKEIDAINKQISAFEKESKARQDHLQNLIDQNEREKEAWEDHYEALKEQYNQQLDALEAEKKAAEARKKQAQQEYDDWMDRWDDIRKSIEAPARDLSDILNDIARYGTPAMATQVDRVTELLRELGYVLDDVTAGSGYDPDDSWGNGGSGMTRREIIDQMLANGQAYANASPAEQARLYEENQRLGALIGAHYENGQWDIFDYGPHGATVKPGVYDDDWNSGYRSGVRSMSLEDLENDGWDTYAAQNGIYSTTRSYETSYNTTGGTATTSSVDDHSITMNGVTIGSSMVHRPLSETLQLVGLHMGT
ncbi:phage tail tape measure protein [Pseudoflavonifractor sp. 60]|uniref:phage tail tape measure protein n=1 Tax=Pseudoflavonifractor sp. 60 TaxID=2304576 RepID=UPI001370A041|nr:phage tail tape measure protein [Pseudoflavonifractor sp. 60]NBI67612.1 phage tail tape measure protein [Pseudoflavonifractor sp. 60]